jgi:short-subunit dehydrogenase
MNVIVTGASRGIGKAIAEKFAAAGYSLFLNARNRVKLEEMVEEMKTKFPDVKILSMAADLSKKENADAFGDWCISNAQPHILVNNAGGFTPGSMLDESAGSLEKMMDNNLYSAYYLTRKIAPVMMKNKSGHIFNISSVAALQAYDGGGSYSISKFALNGFSTNLRHELKPHSVKVTTVFPGAVLTDSWGDFDNTDKRIMEAADVADMIVAATKLSVQAVVEEIILRPQLGDL